MVTPLTSSPCPVPSYPTASIQDYYDFWDCFVEYCRVCNTPSPASKHFTASKCGNPGGWEFPTGLFANSNNPADPTIDVMPEPWWGWNPGFGNLNSVVINYNPGNGGNHQLWSRSPLTHHVGYSSLVQSEVSGATSIFLSTSDWHCRYRAKPIHNVLIGSGTCLSVLKNHLSVELIPWHTPDIKNLGTYLNSNLNSIIQTSLAFASCASNLIIGILSKTVIIRISSLSQPSLFASLGFLLNPITPSYVSLPHSPGHYGRFQRFTHPLFSGINFVCIWGNHFNSLPLNLSTLMAHPQFLP